MFNINSIELTPDHLSTKALTIILKFWKEQELQLGYLSQTRLRSVITISKFLKSCHMKAKYQNVLGLVLSNTV